MHRLIVFAITLLIFLIKPSYAKNESEEEGLTSIYGDEEMVSIATGTAKPVSRAPSVASVITAADIAAMGARNLDEVLESVPGVHVARSQTAWLQPVYGIRGIATSNNPQTMVLIDGFRTQYLHNGGTVPTFRLPLDAVQRIEVIRGPGSAVYGADAYAGVVNIITKTGSEIAQTRLAARTGSFSTSDGIAQWGTTLSDWQMGITVENQRSAGDKDRVVQFDLQTFFDSNFGTSASLAPGPMQSNYDITDAQLKISNKNWTLHWWSWQQHGAGAGQGAAQAVDTVSRLNNSTNLLSVAYDLPDFTNNWQLGFRLSYHHMHTRNEFQLFPPGTVLPIGPDGNIASAPPLGIVLFTDGYIGKPGSNEESTYAESYFTYSGWSNQRLRLSFGGRRDHTETYEEKNFGPGVLDCQPTSSPFLDCEGGVIDGSLTQVRNTEFIYLPNSTRNSSFIAVQDEWSLARDWELTAGLRYDKYSDFGTTTNPRIALVWQTSYNLTAKLLYGHAFRAPSFCELHCINNPVIIGNPNLNPETIKTTELAFNYKVSENVALDLSLFDYKAKDLIEFVAGTDSPAKVATNARDQNGQGFEFELDWRFSDYWRLKSNAAFVDATDAQSGNAIADIPRQHEFVNLSWSLAAQWVAGLQMDHVADRRRSNTDSRSAIDDFTWLDISLRRSQLFGLFDLAFSVRNVTDATAGDPSPVLIPKNDTIPSPSVASMEDYPREGRSYWVEIGIAWGGR